MSKIKGYTSESLSDGDGGVSFEKDIATIFMSNGCDSAVELRVAAKELQDIKLGAIRQFNGFLVSAVQPEGPKLENVAFDCTRK